MPGAHDCDSHPGYSPCAERIHMQDNHDNQDGGRRQFLKCMAWAGAGTLWLMKGGVLHAQPLDGGA